MREIPFVRESLNLKRSQKMQMVYDMGTSLKNGNKAFAAKNLNRRGLDFDPESF
jgi:hypothetical protein